MTEVIREWSGKKWHAFHKEESLVIHFKSQKIEILNTETNRFKIFWSWFCWRIQIDDLKPMKLRGLGRKQAKFIGLILDLNQVRSWYLNFKSLAEFHQEKQIWVPREAIESLKHRKPRVEIREVVHKLGIQKNLQPIEIDAIEFLSKNIDLAFTEINQQILDSELISQRNFLENIESKPLSPEQSKAVLIFDNRVLLVAAAGSGKTSVMIARAAYATKKKLIEPSKILMLAFNKSASEELQERVESRFKQAKLDSEGIRASTFHSYGLDVIGKARGARPKLAPWVDKNREIEEIVAIVKGLKDSSEDFKYRWDLYKLIFTPDTLKIVGVDPDDWDEDSRERGFRTFDGNLVRSHGERMICNWLYLHGIKYEYERDYNVRTADEFHRQYAPDFYYPDIDAWHEHWALDLSGKPPKSFTGYLEQINWKRNLHKIHKTRLIETTFGEVVFSNGLLTLKETLMDLGIQIDWNPERPKAEFTEIEDTSLIRLVRAFMTHVKSNSLTQVDIEKRLLGEWAHLASERTKTFLELYWPIHKEWNKRLSNGNYIDFEDMLVQAAFEIEEGRYRPEYDLILVDEFQDSSVARGRLIKALLMVTNKYALMVGDDWQSINRFAGADVSQMTKFHEEFGEGPTLVLSKTYRCSPTIADLSTSFVGKNPEQIKKVVEAERINPNLPVILVRTVDPQDGVHQILKRIESENVSSTNASVFILGRYNFNEDWIPHDKYRNLDIKFSTVHSSKGLEADYVVIVNCEYGRHGFPSEIEDDPVLNLAMSTPDKFEFAEERRLFYVAITRARKQVFMVSRINRESMFIAELLSENLLNVVTLDNSSTQKNSVQSCPKCKKGIMNLRSGKYGKFLGCSRFPKCDSTMNL